MPLEFSKTSFCSLPDSQDLLAIMVSIGYHRNQDPGQSTPKPSPTFCKEQNLPPNTS